MILIFPLFFLGSGGWDKKIFNCYEVAAGTDMVKCGASWGRETFDTYKLAVIRLASSFDRPLRHVSLPPTFPPFKHSFHTRKSGSALLPFVVPVIDPFTFLI